MEKNSLEYKNCFKDGPIKPEFIADSISKHQSKIGIGAHQIFLGQVREDIINNNKVQAIDYSAYKDMANKVFHEIREDAYSKFDLICMHIYHSFGIVKKGEICLFVFVSSKHRKVAMNAIEYVVEEIKLKAPIFGKEIFEDNNYVWKENKFD